MDSDVFSLRQRKILIIHRYAIADSPLHQTGYREGITAGKESALQEGFDAGFAQIGVPLGRELGILRGVASAMLAFLSSQSNADAMSSYISEARDIATRLADVRFSDIAPRDLEAEQHAREHLQSYGEELDENEDITEKRQVEQLEDMMNQLTAGTGPAAVMNGHKRPGMEDVKALRSRLEALGIVTGVDVKTLCS